MVTPATYRNQILFSIFTRMTPNLPMMHFEVGHCSAELASPAVPLQVGSAKLFVLLTFQANRT